ncbi:DUF1592 domain-containing protein [bacterium]|nr:DUF1592 domain-containing protein [bacterium]
MASSHRMIPRWPLLLAVLLTVGPCLAASADDGRVVMRRLNRVEYENTVRDLLGVHVELQELLPLDSSRDGFDNVGEALHVSSFLMEKYLEAASTALDVAIANGSQPQLIKRRYSLKTTHQVRTTTEDVFWKSDDHDRVVMFSSSAWQSVSLTPFYPKDRGDYRFRICTSAVNSDGKPMTYRVDAGLMLMTGRPHLVGYFDAPAGEPAVVEFVDSLEPRNTIRLLPYGLASAQEVKKVGAAEWAGPGLAVEWIEVEGPLHDRWPPESHRRIFGDLPQKPAPIYNQRDRVEVVSDDPVSDATTIVRRFASRAFRRPATDEEVASFVAVIADRLDEGQSFEQAVRVGLLAVLVSPEFLFLHETPGRLDDYAIASRLSYFLWSTMPDDELLDLAQRQQLTQQEVLRVQVDRMLDDPRAAAFHHNFVGQWLSLRDIDFTRPSGLLYPEFDDMLKASMVREAELFFAELLKEDLSVTNIVASDFSMLNGRLAQHYGIDGVDGWEFHRTPLPPGSHRGGVITMAGVLKVTANGTYTSPVTRGAWVLDRILGTPPSLPPESVDGLVPDTRGTTTIREQLAKHRAIESCAGCHEEIDPPGFALESFDVIGGWRDLYRLSGWRRDSEQITVNGRKIYLGDEVDSADVLPDGRSFRGIDEFRQLLLEDKDQLARAITERLLTYGTGAASASSDFAEINAIVDRVRAKDYGLRSLIHEIVTSDLFLMK